MSDDPNQGQIPALAVRDLVARYGERTVLDGVNLTVPPGEIRVILGGSGGGKSTLLKHCIGLLEPAEGEIHILGSQYTQMSAAQRVKLMTRVGVLFQNGALLGSLTIQDNIALPLVEHTDLPRDVIEEIVRLKLLQVEMGHAAHLLPSELSGGMRKRAALARAMALDPDLLFCDEPSAGLDPLTSAELDKTLMRMRDQFGMAVVVVTHEMDSIETITDKAIFLSKGKVVADGTLDELRENDHHEVVAFFARQAAGDMRGPKRALDVLTGGGPAREEQR